MRGIPLSEAEQKRDKNPVYKAFDELFRFLSVTSNPYAVLRKVFNVLDEIGAFEKVGRGGASIDVDALIRDKLNASSMTEEDLGMMDDYVETAAKGEPRVCLFCKSVNIVPSSINVTTRGMIQYVTCEDCNGAWNDVYSLQGVLIESRPEVTPGGPGM